MHPYSTDSDERRKILFGLAIISVAIGIGIGRFLSGAASNIPFIELVDAPSALFLYGLLYTGFNRWGWHTVVAQKTGLVKVPDLRGTWKGYVKSSYDDHAEEYDIELEIHQRWTQIEINLHANNSSSISRAGSILVENSVSNTVAYEYLNEPHPDAPLDMHIHKGTTILKQPHDDEDTLEGEYYSGRGRQRFGYIHIERENDNN